MSKQLSGQALADAVAKRYREHLRAIADEHGDDGHLYASYNGGGWIELGGSNLPCHRELREVYKNGWSLLYVQRSSHWREWLSKEVGE